MGKKGSWFSAIKKVFVHNSKDKRELESKNWSDTRKKAREQKHVEPKSYIPIFREPSSIEKILEEIDEQRLHIRPITPFDPPKTPPFLTPRASSPKAASIRVTSPRAYSQKAASPKAAYSRDVSRKKEIKSYGPERTLQNRHLFAIKIQAAYRGYMARKGYRALRGLVRLQGVVRGQNVKRQTENAMKVMQLLVRIQTQIQSQRTHASNNQTFQGLSYKFDEEQDNASGKWAISQSETGNLGEWDDSTLTKEEREARMKKKKEAASKRERAMAYAYSNQYWKSNPKSAPNAWWWNRLEPQLPDSNNPPETQSIRSYNLAPQRRTPEPKPSPQPQSTYKPIHYMTFENYEMMTPTSTRSMVPTRSKQFMPTPTRKTPPRQSLGTTKNTKTKPARASSVFEMGLKDDDSLASSSSYSVPNYMSPTASAQAKSRPKSNPKERFPGTPTNDSKNRFSFPLTPNIGSFKWKKGSSKTGSGSKNVVKREESFRSEGDFSVDSGVSMPAAAGRIFIR